MDGGRTQKPSGGTQAQRGSSVEPADQLPGSTIEEDRRWALGRARMILRKASGAGEAEAGQDASLSEPGEPAEKEADAVADHVADDLHGGEGKPDGKKKAASDAANGSDGAKAEQGGGKQGGADAGQEKAPAIGAKLEGVGRKVFLARKSGKEKADDIPSWAAGCQMNPGETPVQAADRVMRRNTTRSRSTSSGNSP